MASTVNASSNQPQPASPPWKTISTPNAQERREYVVKTLNEAFSSVGLLPPTRPRGASVSRPAPQSAVVATAPEAPAALASDPVKAEEAAKAPEEK